jgi:hypothetical protein
VAAAAAQISVPQTPSNIVYSFGINSNDMTTIYMLPDPYFGKLVKPIDLQKVNLTGQFTAELRLFEWIGQLILGGMDTGTHGSKINCWRTCIRAATLLQVGDYQVHTVQDVQDAFAKSIHTHPSCPLLFAYPEIRQDISHNGLPIMHRSNFSQAMHDQLNDPWNFLMLAP